MVYHSKHTSFTIFVTFLFLCVSLSSFVLENYKGLLEIDFLNKSRESTRLGINATIFGTGNVDTSSPQKYVNYSTKVFQYSSIPLKILLIYEPSNILCNA